MPSWVSIQDDTEATLLFPPAANRYESLVISLVTILERASLLRGAQAVAKNTSQANKEAENVSDLPPLPFHPASEVTLVFSTAPDVFYTLTVCAAEAVRLLSRNLAILHSDRGVISFVYSLILTRTLKQVCADIDNVGDPLVAAFGHTTQELVNLVITGVACSNVFDNQKSMSLSIDGPATSSLRGVSQQPDVGYLSLHECLNYLEVGHLLKNPKYPIWVVGSETHYTVLFALDPRVGKLSAHEKREGMFDGMVFLNAMFCPYFVVGSLLTVYRPQCLTLPACFHFYSPTCFYSALLAEVKGIFQQLDPQNNGFLTRDTAAILVESLGLDASTVSVLDPDRQGIVLWEAVRAHFCPYPEEAKASAKPAPGARGDGGGGNGGSGDGSQPGSGSGATPATWSCPACTLTNAYALTKCAVCGSNRPAAPPPSAAPAAPAPAAPAPAAPAAPAKDWSCGVCTYWNTGARSRCEICDSAKPAPPPAPAPAPAPADSQGGVSSTSTSTSTSGGGGGKGNGSGNEEQKAPAPVPVARKLPRIGDGQPQSFSLYHINGLGGIVKKKASPTASRTTSLASVPSGGPSDMADTSNTGVSTYPGTATIADSSQSMTEALPSKSPVLQGATYTVSNRSQTAVALETPVVICRCEISLFDVTVNKSLSYAANLREIIGTRWPTAQVDYVGPAPKIT